MDGKVIIGTELDTKGLDKGLKEIENNDDLIEKKKVSVELDIKELDRQYKEVQKRIDELNSKTTIEYSGSENMAMGISPNLTEQEVEEFDRLTDLLDDIWAKKEELLSLQQQINGEAEEQTKINKDNLDNINKWVDGVYTLENGTKLVKKNTKELAQESRNIDFSQIKTSVDGIGDSVKKVIHKVTRWGLAIFGIRSAYMFVRQEMSVLAGYNEQLGTDLQYMRFALATALQPVIEAIVKLAYKLLVYIAYIAKAWFGVNIFAKASSKAFGEANNKVKATNKSAKELSKTLAGFDEMNILQENGGVGTGGGGGGITAPSIDLSDWDNVKIPKWIEWIAKNKDLILNFLKDIASWFITVKIALFLEKLTGIFTIMRSMQGLSLFALIGGLAITILGIYDTIKGLIDWIADPTWENFTKVLEGLEEILIGVGIAMIALNNSNPVGWIITAIGVVGKLVTKLTKQKKSTDDLREAEKKLKDARKNLTNATDDYISAVEDAEEAQKKLKDAQNETGINIDELLKKMEDEGLGYQDLNEEQRKVYKAYNDNKIAQDNLTDSKKKLKTATKDEVNASMDVQREVGKEKGKYDELKESIIKNFEQSKISAKDAREQIAKAMEGMDDDTKKVFVDGIPDKIMKAYDPKKYQGKWNTFEYWWNKSIESLKNTITLDITTNITSTFWSATEKAVAKIKKSAKGAMIYPANLPRLAVGGIINNPGAGVPYRGSIIGERGAEAVVPLTDSQQMSLLGEAIGRYITVELTNVTQLDGRQIARKVEQINNNNKFVLNR